jgi:hypothetical protein
MSHRLMALLPALLTFVLTFAQLAATVPLAEPHGDEDQYIWSAAYFGGKLATIDLRRSGVDANEDPGWAPDSFWAQTQPMGARLLIAVGLGLAGVEVPAAPYWFGQPPERERQTTASPAARTVGRLMAALAAAAGLALIAARLGWAGLAAALGFLLLPSVRDDLARAWAEGPLLFGFGLATLAFGTRWFGIACGVAATFKLTALGLWPLALWPRWNGGQRPGIGMGAALVSWSALTPSSWFMLGPLYLAIMLRHRLDAYAEQSVRYGGELGIFLPSRYVWPLELMVLVLLAVVLRAAARWWSQHRVAHPAGPARVPERLGGGRLRAAR